jgi:ABC-type phosphate transport system substrate-binding protein
VRRHRIITATALSLALATIGAACGDDDGSGSGSESGAGSGSGTADDVAGSSTDNPLVADAAAEYQGAGYPIRST